MAPLAGLQITISAEAVAWYGAIVATISVAVVGYSVWRDRPRLRVEAKPNMKFLDDSGQHAERETFIIIQVSNIGRRPMTLRELPYFRLKGEKTAGIVVNGPWRPKDRLDEGESAWMRCRQSGLDLSTIRTVVVTCATGKQWHGRLSDRSNDDGNSDANP